MFTTHKRIYSPQNGPSTPQMRKYFDGKQSDLSHTQEFLVAAWPPGSLVICQARFEAPKWETKKDPPPTGSGSDLAGSIVPGPEHVRPNDHDQVARPGARREPNQPGTPAGVIDPHGPTAPGATPTPHATGGERRQVPGDDGQTARRVFVIVVIFRHGTREQVDAISHGTPTTRRASTRPTTPTRSRSHRQRNRTTTDRRTESTRCTRCRLAAV